MAFLATVALGFVPASANAPIEQTATESPYVVEQYVEYVAPIPTPVPKRISYRACSCVNIVKDVVGYTEPVGLAKNWPITTQIPQAGAVVVMRSGWTGHVAYVLRIEEGFLVLYEGNWTRCRLTVGRKVSVNDPSIIGYWMP